MFFLQALIDIHCYNTSSHRTTIIHNAIVVCQSVGSLTEDALR